MSSRLLTDDGMRAGLASVPVSVVDGAPRAGLVELTNLGSTEIGIWELTDGTVSDVEVDEVFVVLAGEATVRFPDGSALELRPGVVARLYAGDETVWEVRSTLRKLYVAPADPVS